MGFHLVYHYFHCWKCRGHHALATLRRLGVPDDIAREFLTHADIGPPEFKRERTRVSLKEPAFRQELGRAHMLYLENRGFKPKDIVKLWGVEGISVAPKLSWRIYIPVIQHETKVSWTTRAIGERVEQRYVSAAADDEVVNHKHVLYGADYCRHSVVIVEGPLDAWAIGPGAVALFGTAYTRPQLFKLLQFTNRFICFDSDKTAQDQAEKLAGELSCFPGKTSVIQLDAKDPGSASPKELDLVRRAARLDP